MCQDKMVTFSDNQGDRLQEGPQAGPYRFSRALANSTSCLVIATAKDSYIASFITNLIVTHFIVEALAELHIQITMGSAGTRS